MLELTNKRSSVLARGIVARKSWVLIVAAVCVNASAGGPQAAAADDAGARPPKLESADARRSRIAREFRSGVEILAADDMQGRGLGTAGLSRAASWIEGRLRDPGFDPAFGSSYRQNFQVKVGVALVGRNELKGVADGDWTPLGMSSNGGFSGELAFVGYGIEAPPIGFRELSGLDIEGKIVLMLRYEPQERDEASPFNGKKPSRWSALRYKILQARERGAAAVIFATGPLQDESEDRIPALTNDGPESPSGIPVIQVRTSVARRWLKQAGIDLQAFQEQVDRDLVPRSNDATGIRLEGHVELAATYEDVVNLAGVISGRGIFASDVLVVGAHYDHLGMGGDRSMRPNESAIHNGADDNASGTMAAIQIGEELKSVLARESDHRTVVVALFSAEEVGLAGSARFVEAPPFPMERHVAMVNLDMVGRLKDDTLIAFGSESASEWGDWIDRARRAVPGLKVTSSGDGYGPSDQTSFYAAGVPVLHLFTGSHDAYHTPDDTADTVNADGGARVVAFSTSLLRDLAVQPVRLTYEGAGAAPTMWGDSRGFGAYLGTIPDYTAMESAEGGVLLADVRKGGPADLAGIRGRDRIVKMAGTRIENLYDMTYALQDSKPGQTIEVVVVRDDKDLRFLSTLGDRAAMAKQGEEGEAEKDRDPAAMHPSLPAAPPPKEAVVAAAEDVAAFYRGRPGDDFRVGAGKPFLDTVEHERHLAEIRQLTFGGENAEAYFSPDGRRLIYQATVPGADCDQQYVMDLGTGDSELVSSGKGRTTCGYFDWPEGDRIVYASTETAGDECPLPPDHSRGYVWALYDTFDIFEARPDGSGARRLTESPGYDAEATWCHRGGEMVFTSMRDGDLDLYAMDEAGNVRRLTQEEGYDGGAFFSPDCSEIVWRASRPEGEDLVAYRRLLSQNLIRPTALEIFVMNADGSAIRQLTANGAANFCPTFTADGSKIVYASNYAFEAGAARPREFDLWLVDKAGGESEQVTFARGFDGFPQFSPDGRWLVWASNRADPGSGETNIFIARWVP